MVVQQRRARRPPPCAIRAIRTSLIPSRAISFTAASRIRARALARAAALASTDWTLGHDSGRAGEGVRRRDPDPARGRRGARAADRRGRRADPARGARARVSRRPARARARRAGLDARRVVRGRGAVRALDQRALVARPDGLQRARPRHGRSRSSATSSPRCAASCTTPTRSPRSTRAPIPPGSPRRRREPPTAGGSTARSGSSPTATSRRSTSSWRSRREPTLFLVDAGTPGISVVDDPPFTHNYPHGHPTLRFEGVEVGEDAVIGGVGGGDELQRAWFAEERLGIAARGCGAMLRLLEETTAWAIAREQGGARIIDHQGVSFPLADCAADAAAGRLLGLEVARLADAGADPKLDPRQGVDGEAVRRPRPRTAAPTAACRSSAAAATRARTSPSASGANCAWTASGRARARSSA